MESYLATQSFERLSYVLAWGVGKEREKVAHKRQISEEIPRNERDNGDFLALRQRQQGPRPLGRRRVRRASKAGALELPSLWNDKRFQYCPLELYRRTMAKLVESNEP